MDDTNALGGCDSGPVVADFGTLPAWAQIFEKDGGIVQTEQGRLRVSVPSFAPLAAAAVHSSTFSFADLRLRVEVDVAQVIPSTSTYVFICSPSQFDCALDQVPGVMIRLASDVLYAEAAGQPSFTRDYDALADRVWQLRELAGVTYAETSSDGVEFRPLAIWPSLTEPVELWLGAVSRSTTGGGAAYFDALGSCP